MDVFVFLLLKKSPGVRASWMVWVPFAYDAKRLPGAPRGSQTQYDPISTSNNSPATKRSDGAGEVREGQTLPFEN
jgi:hypothetical protein